MKLKIITLICIFSGALMAQSPSVEYIEKWHAVAQAEMKAYGIPASITLAQGILESASGKSKLATEGNNHFGIKCHLEWDGDKIYADDDEKGECFRSYSKAEESFRDHSLFLSTRSRYASLFKEKPTDYEAWAKGLKKAGYATNRKYADLLIDLIERYDLSRFDQIDFEELSEAEIAEGTIAFADQHLIKLSSNKVKYIIARSGDTWESLAQFADCKGEDLLDYNELRYDASLEDGQIIYLQPKRRRASREHRIHLVQDGESMYDISQKFGVRLEKLYERNNLNIGVQPPVGTRLELR